MRIALEMASRGMAAGGPPVGACLVRDGEVLAKAHNRVISDLDITAHAEIALLREACREQRTLSLAGCVLYVTVQPCAMCLAACHYAGIDTIVFGAAIESMAAITGNEISLPAGKLFAGSEVQPAVTGGVLAPECEALLTRWGGGGAG